MLGHTLDALRKQTLPPERFEVVVVADACTDATAQVVADFARTAGFSVQFHEHEAMSAAATRNLGAHHARGEMLLFMDDDIIAAQQLAQAHLDAHPPTDMGCNSAVVLGYSKPVYPQNASWWQCDARTWWEDEFHRMTSAGHRFTYRHFFSGNVSLSKKLFDNIGGFDLSMSGRLEDYEIGARLIKAGARFKFAPQAMGEHHDNTTYDKWLARVKHEGIASILIGDRHPELRAEIFGNVVAPAATRQERFARVLATKHPRLGDALFPAALKLAHRLERIRLRHRWRAMRLALREYCYLRGVCSQIGDLSKLSSWLQDGPPLPTVASDAPVVDVLKLSQITDAELLEASRKGVRLTCDGIEVTTLPPRPGAESLRVEHLAYAFGEHARRTFVPALAIHFAREFNPNAGVRYAG